MPTSGASKFRSSSTRASGRRSIPRRTSLVNAGIPVLIDAKHAIAHNKVMVIDDQTVITGSFNFTKAAEEHNAENLLVIRDKDLAEQVRGQLAGPLRPLRSVQGEGEGVLGNAPGRG